MGPPMVKPNWLYTVCAFDCAKTFRAARAPQFRLVVAGRNVDGCERLDGRNEDGEQPAAVIVIDSFDLHIIGQPGLPVHSGGERILRVEKFRMWAKSAGCAGNQVEQTL